MRVRDLAKELNVSNNEVLNALKEHGFELANYMSSVDEAQADLARKSIKGVEKKTKKAASTDKRVGSKVIRRRKNKEEAAAEAASESEQTESEEAETEKPAKKKVVRKTVRKAEEEKAAAPAGEDAEAEEQIAAEAEAEETVAAESGETEAAEPAESDETAGEEDSSGGARIIQTGVKIHEKPRPAPSRGGAGRTSSPRPGMPSAPMPGQADERGGASKKKGKKGREVRHPKRRVVTKTDKYRHIFSDGTANLRASATRKKKKHEPKDVSTVPMSDRKRKIRIEQSIMVGDLAKQMGVKAGDIVKKFIEMGMMVTVNQSIDPDTATIIASDYGFEVEVTHQTEEELLGTQPTEDFKDEDLEGRPPVVTVMGHVDHGKTSILDAIRAADVVSGEAGGITQHIGAYQIVRDGHTITFIDTPGHAAFTAMRARGAKVTDLVILVVAANDGVMPQTIEAIQHAQSAEVPVIVAINKMDVEGANPDKVTQQLSEHGIIPEDWGGEHQFIKVSAIKGEGITDLLDAIVLQSEILELKANPKADFTGAVLEASLDKGRGPMATILVQQGTLKVGDILMVDKFYGRVRSLTSDTGEKLKKATPGTPIAIQGLNGVPSAGDTILQVKNEKIAKEIVERRRLKERETELARKNKMSIEDLFANAQGDVVTEVNLLVKGDVHGSVEALRESLEGLSTDECKVVIVGSGVGAITENDVNLASASGASIIGFNIRADSKSSRLAESLGVEIRPYSIIYEVLDDVKAAMLGTLAPEEKEESLGWVRVQEIFPISGVGTIAGSLVESGKVLRNAGVRLIRDGKIIYDGKVENLKRFKDDVKEVTAGQECGILLHNHNDVVIGDEMEIYHIVKTERTEL